MDKNYIMFCLAYDYGEDFDKMNLACDEASELAEELADKFLAYCDENGEQPCYDVFCEYFDKMNFNEVQIGVKSFGGGITRFS